MTKWKITFDVLWEEGGQPKRQIIRVKEELTYVIQLVQALSSCRTISFVKLVREDSID